MRYSIFLLTAGVLFRSIKVKIASFFKSRHFVTLALSCDRIDNVRIKQLALKCVTKIVD